MLKKIGFFIMGLSIALSLVVGVSSQVGSDKKADIVPPVGNTLVADIVPPIGNTAYKTV